MVLNKWFIFTTACYGLEDYSSRNISSTSRASFDFTRRGAKKSRKSVGDLVSKTWALKVSALKGIWIKCARFESLDAGCVASFGKLRCSFVRGTASLETFFCVPNSSGYSNWSHKWRIPRVEFRVFVSVITGETVHVFRGKISLECVNVVLVAVLGGGGGGRREKGGWGEGTIKKL